MGREVQTSLKRLVKKATTWSKSTSAHLASIQAAKPTVQQRPSALLSILQGTPVDASQQVRWPVHVAQEDGSSLHSKPAATGIASKCTADSPSSLEQSSHSGSTSRPGQTPANPLAAKPHNSSHVSRAAATRGQPSAFPQTAVVGSCPLCDVELPLSELQAHVDAELLAMEGDCLEEGDSSTWPASAGQCSVEHAAQHSTAHMLTAQRLQHGQQAQQLAAAGVALAASRQVQRPTLYGHQQPQTEPHQQYRQHLPQHGRPADTCQPTWQPQQGLGQGLGQPATEQRGATQQRGACQPVTQMHRHAWQRRGDQEADQQQPRQQQGRQLQGSQAHPRLPKQVPHQQSSILGQQQSTFVPARHNSYPSCSRDMHLTHLIRADRSVETPSARPAPSQQWPRQRPVQQPPHHHHQQQQPHMPRPSSQETNTHGAAAPYRKRSAPDSSRSAACFEGHAAGGHMQSVAARHSRPAGRPLVGASAHNSRAQHGQVSKVLVLGDDPKNVRPMPVRRRVAQPQHYNHYTDGGGFWDSDMVGLDGAACDREQYEGVGVVRLGNSFGAQ